jgi:hypothetical protein
VGTEGFFPQLKWPGRKADHLTLSSAEVKNKWSQARDQNGSAGLQTPKRNFKRHFIGQDFNGFCTIFA